MRDGEAAQRAEGDGMVAAEHERQRAGADRLPHEQRNLRTGGEDLGQVARSLVVHRGRLRLGRLDVPEVPDVVTQRDEPFLEIRVAKGGGAHVDPAAPLTEVERGADDRDGLRGHGCGA